MISIYDKKQNEVIICDVAVKEDKLKNLSYDIKKNCSIEYNRVVFLPRYGKLELGDQEELMVPLISLSKDESKRGNTLVPIQKYPVIIDHIVQLLHHNHRALYDIYQSFGQEVSNQDTQPVKKTTDYFEEFESCYDLIYLGKIHDIAYDLLVKDISINRGCDPYFTLHSLQTKEEVTKQLSLKLSQKR